MIWVVGGGLSGVEAAYKIASYGIRVKLVEMRPNKMTPAHHTGDLAELICSNSLKAERLETASGLLKSEMHLMNSIILDTAYKTRVEAGGALAVDRIKFSQAVTEITQYNNNIEIIRGEVKSLDELDGIKIVATGPLTSESLFKSIKGFTGEENLYFYDAAAPIVAKDSIDMDNAFFASRYDRGEADYINCPMNEREYYSFVEALISAETIPLKEFEEEKVFEGCMPVEKMAKRGAKTLSFGPMKPKGLKDPKTGKEPYAVVQLRKDNSEGTLYNLVGFQTNLKWPEQKRVFSAIPALKNAEFVRYGVMHRNTFINSPKVLDSTLETRKDKNIFFAGQITGVEGYMESAASGIVAGINAARLYQGKDLISLPRETMIGSLLAYISDRNKRDIQPMNSNFGILPPLGERVKNKNEAKLRQSERSIRVLKEFLEKEGL